MNKITDIRFESLKNSIYLKPYRMCYKQNGKEKFWDLMEVHDSVSIIIYNVTRNVLVFVKQFRPGVYCKKVLENNSPNEKKIDTDKYPGDLGMTIELCAGIVDKQKSLEEIAREEILEECGYDVPVEKLEKVISFSASIGYSGTVLTMYYCEVTDDMKITAGGGIDDEMIEVIEMTVPEVKQYLNSCNNIPSPGSVIAAYYWFITNKVHKL